MTHSVNVTIEFDGLSATIAVPLETAVTLILRHLISGGAVVPAPGHILETILTNTERLLQMSQNLAQGLATEDADIAALTTGVAALGTEITAGLAANTSTIAALQAQIAAGNPVTAAQLADLDTNNSAVAAATVNLAAATSTLQAALNPPAPPTP